MTIGQRIAQKRRELSFSQEALGQEVGVSRQSIYRWESDAAVPEIDKLIALSRLFGVSVGWLLGVEETPGSDSTDGAAAPSSAPEELTEAQLNMVEQIVARYTAALPKPKRRRWPFVLALIALAVVLLNLFHSLDTLRLQQENMFNDISRVESSVNRQIGSISSQVEEILKAQNALTADYGCEWTGTDPAANTASFHTWAVPKTFKEGMSAVFQIDSGSGPSEVPAVSEPGQTFSADLTADLTDSITVAVVFIAPDGTRSTQLLNQFSGLYSDTMPSVDVQSNLMWMPLQNGALVLGEDSHERYIWTREQQGSAAESPTAVADVQVALFKNRKLAAWAEPCQQPDSFQGFEDCSFYRLPELRLPLTAQDTVQIAAVVTDEYGRTAIWQDLSYTLDPADGVLIYAEDTTLDHDPANWDF